MVNLVNIQKINGVLWCVFEDGTMRETVATTGGVYLLAGEPLPGPGPDPEPPEPNPATRFIWPFSLASVTSEYGMRNGKLHAGMDFAKSEAGNGKPIPASAAGKVVRRGPSGGYGNLVVLDHGGGLHTAYAHMQDGSFAVSMGDNVTQKQILGKVGSTGNSFGAHLHFECHEGGFRPNATAKNPRTFIPTHNGR